MLDLLNGCILLSRLPAVLKSSCHDFPIKHACAVYAAIRRDRDRRPGPDSQLLSTYIMERSRVTDSVVWYAPVGFHPMPAIVALALQRQRPPRPRCVAC